MSSKLASDLELALKDDNNVSGISKLMAAMSGGTPGYRAYDDSSKRQIAGILRSAKMYYAGADSWASGEQAVNVTSERLQTDALHHLVIALCSGIQMGQAPEWRDHQNHEELFSTNVDFQLATTLNAINVSMDRGVMEQMKEYIAQTVVAIVERTGFREQVGRETLHVWDIWFAVLGSSAASFFIAGTEIGSKWYEEQILSSIAQATGEGAGEIDT